MPLNWFCIYSSIIIICLNYRCVKIVWKIKWIESLNDGCFYCICWFRGVVWEFSRGSIFGGFSASLVKFIISVPKNSLEITISSFFKLYKLWYLTWTSFLIPVTLPLLIPTAPCPDLIQRKIFMLFIRLCTGIWNKK